MSTETQMKPKVVLNTFQKQLKRYYSHPFLTCKMCKEPFSKKNVLTTMGCRETQISGFCELCFDNLMKGV